MRVSFTLLYCKPAATMRLRMYFTRFRLSNSPAALRYPKMVYDGNWVNCPTLALKNNPSTLVGKLALTDAVG